MTFQFSIWDKFRDLENLPTTNFSNLVHLVAHLLKTKSLPLSILKVCVMHEIIKRNDNDSVIACIWYLKKTISLDSDLPEKSFRYRSHHRKQPGQDKFSWYSEAQ